MFKIKLKDKSTGDFMAATVINVIVTTIATVAFAGIEYIAAYAGGMCEPEFWTSTFSNLWLFIVLVLTATETFKIKPTGFIGNTVAKIWNSDIFMYIMCIVLALTILFTIYVKYNCIE